MPLALPTHGRTESAPIVFSDFDGTITQIDVTDAILEQLADPAWHAVEDEWVEGEIGSRECLARQMALVHASRRELDALIDAIPVDPGFPAFHRFTLERSIPFYVVSDGFDYVIQRVLGRAGVDGPLRNGRHLFSSAMSVRGRRLATRFPHPGSGCEHGCATCKATLIQRLTRGSKPVVFIGDGLSDRFAVHEADLVFARPQLLEYCRDHSITAQPFQTFADVQARLGKVLGRRAVAAGRQSSGKRNTASRKAEALAVR